MRINLSASAIEAVPPSLSNIPSNFYTATLAVDVLAIRALVGTL